MPLKHTPCYTVMCLMAILVRFEGLMVVKMPMLFCVVVVTGYCYEVV
jgi:hypothetical protein